MGLERQEGLVMGTGREKGLVMGMGRAEGREMIVSVDLNYLTPTTPIFYLTKDP